MSWFIWRHAPPRARVAVIRSAINHRRIRIITPLLRLVLNRTARLSARTTDRAVRCGRLIAIPVPLLWAVACRRASLMTRVRLRERPPYVVASETLSLCASPPRMPRLSDALSLTAVPYSLSAVEVDRLRAWPNNVPRAVARLLLTASPPIAAAMLSLSATALPPSRPRASASELLIASPWSAVATDRLLAYAFRPPIASLLATARPPFVAPAIATESALPVAVEVAEALPPFELVATAMASPARAGPANSAAEPRIVASRRFMVFLLLGWAPHAARPVVLLAVSTPGLCELFMPAGRKSSATAIMLVPQVFLENPLNRPTSSNVDPAEVRLIEQAATGDAEAQRQLFEQYRDVAYRVALRITGRAEDAMDIVQDGFIRAFDRLDTFQRDARFKTWLLRIVSNRALDLLRSRKVRLAVSLDAGGEDDPRAQLPAPESHARPAARMEARELATRLREAVDRLPPDQRAVFALYATGEMTYGQIAETLGVPVGTVMSRLYHARRRLHELLPDLAPQQHGQRQ